MGPNQIRPVFLFCGYDLLTAIPCPVRGTWYQICEGPKTRLVKVQNRINISPLPPKGHSPFPSLPGGPELAEDFFNRLCHNLPGDKGFPGPPPLRPSPGVEEVIFRNLAPRQNQGFLSEPVLRKSRLWGAGRAVEASSKRLTDGKWRCNPHGSSVQKETTRTVSRRLKPHKVPPFITTRFRYLVCLRSR